MAKAGLHFTTLSSDLREGVKGINLVLTKKIHQNVLNYYFKEGFKLI